MIGISLKISGLEAIQNKFAEAPQRVAGAISRAIKESAFILEAESKMALTEGPTRALDTGLLRSQNVVRELSDVRAAVYPLVHYAVYVHEGTYKMRARPWFQVAAKNASEKIRFVFDEALTEIMR